MPPRRRRRALPLCAAAAAALAGAMPAMRPAAVRAEGIEQSAGPWLSLRVSGDVHPRLRLALATRVRSFGVFGDSIPTTQLRIGPLIGLKLAEGMHAWAGYEWAPNITGGFVTEEHRAVEQWTYGVRGLPEGFRVDLRARFEERFRPAQSDEMALRLRLLADFAIPFAVEDRLRVAASNELFLALNDAATTAGPDWQLAGINENRAFLGLELGAGANARVAAGYLNQWLPSTTAASPDRMNHYGALLADVSFR